MRADDFTIELKHGSQREAATRDQLCALLDAHDVSRWVRTKRIVIEERAIPHSHPVLTLDTRQLGDEYVLATFLHEQAHWWLRERLGTMYFIMARVFGIHIGRTERAKRKLQRRYPKVHRPFPAGAMDADSTYLHLIVNCLERRAVLEVMGADALARLTPFWLTDHYTAIYDIVLRDHEQIDALIDEHGLGP